MPGRGQEQGVYINYTTLGRDAWLTYSARRVYIAFDFQDMLLVVDLSEGHRYIRSFLGSTSSRVRAPSRSPPQSVRVTSKYYIDTRYVLKASQLWQLYSLASPGVLLGYRLLSLIAERSSFSLISCSTLFIYYRLSFLQTLTCFWRSFFFPDDIRIRTIEDQAHKRTVYLLDHEVTATLCCSSQRFSPCPFL